MTTPLEAFTRRYLAKIEPAPASTCLTWVGARDPKGYGNVAIPAPLREMFGGRRWMKAHLVGLVLFRGIDARTIEHGHHRCDELGEPFAARDCVNQYHVESTTACEHYALHARRRNQR